MDSFGFKVRKIFWDFYRGRCGKCVGYYVLYWAEFCCIAKFIRHGIFNVFIEFLIIIIIII